MPSTGMLISPNGNIISFGFEVKDEVLLQYSESTPDGKLIVDSWGRKLYIDMDSTLSRLGETYEKDGSIRWINITTYNVAIDGAKSNIEVIDDSSSLMQSANNRTKNSTNHNINQTEKTNDMHVEENEEVIEAESKISDSVIVKEINLLDITSSDELLDALFETNTIHANEVRDKQSILEWLERRKTSQYATIYDNNDGQTSDSDRIKNETFDDQSSGITISGDFNKHKPSNWNEYRSSADFRITLKNSQKIVADDAIVFIKTLIEEANKRGLNFETALYCRL